MTHPFRPARLPGRLPAPARAPIPAWSPRGARSSGDSGAAPSHAAGEQRSPASARVRRPARSAARRGFLSFTGWHFLNAFTISRLRLKHLLEASSDFLKISSADSPQKHEECCGRVALAHTWGAAEAGRAGLSQRPRPRVATRSRAEELPAGSTSFLGGSGWEGKGGKKENPRKKGEKKPKQNNFSRSNNELEEKNRKREGLLGREGAAPL